MCDWLARHRGRLFLTLIAVHAALLAISAAIHTPDMNELGQMGAGLSHWETGRFHLHSVNPPLLRIISVVPVLVCTHMSAEDRNHLPHSGAEYQAGYVFALHNGWQALTFFTLARWASIPFRGSDKTGVLGDNWLTHYSRRRKHITLAASAFHASCIMARRS
ncbi:MAG: hypothetical protein K6T86_18715, partial [Pirellulales bacterium]|nr:hypothetical protein [Pirellulales bacterium]